MDRVTVNRQWACLQQDVNGEKKSRRCFPFLKILRFNPTNTTHSGSAAAWIWNEAHNTKSSTMIELIIFVIMVINTNFFHAESVLYLVEFTENLYDWTSVVNLSLLVGYGWSYFLYLCMFHIGWTKLTDKPFILINFGRILFLRKKCLLDGFQFIGHISLSSFSFYTLKKNALKHLPLVNKWKLRLICITICLCSCACMRYNFTKTVLWTIHDRTAFSNHLYFLTDLETFAGLWPSGQHSGIWSHS